MDYDLLAIGGMDVITSGSCWCDGCKDDRTAPFLSVGIAHGEYGASYCWECAMALTTRFHKATMGLLAAVTAGLLAKGGA